MLNFELSKETMWGGSCFIWQPFESESLLKFCWHITCLDHTSQLLAHPACTPLFTHPSFHIHPLCTYCLHLPTVLFLTHSPVLDPTYLIPAYLSHPACLFNLSLPALLSHPHPSPCLILACPLPHLPTYLLPACLLIFYLSWPHLPPLILSWLALLSVASNHIYSCIPLNIIQMSMTL